MEGQQSEGLDAKGTTAENERGTHVAGTVELKTE
jgi:hypothetical protein